MTVNKDVIRQIILDFNEFKNEGVWLCSFEEIVGEFLETQSLDCPIDREE